MTSDELATEAIRAAAAGDMGRYFELLGVAMGQLNEDGTVRDQDEPDWATLADNATFLGAAPDLLDPDPSPHPAEGPF